MYRNNNTRDGRGEVEVYFYKTDKLYMKCRNITWT